VQLRDRRGALATAKGIGTKTMVFVTSRRPRGTLRLVVTQGQRVVHPVRVD
jgi:hypothetical protein